MTKSELINELCFKHAHLNQKDVEYSVKVILEHMVKTLSTGERIEIRGFGSFSLRHRTPRTARNPKTGESVAVTSKVRPHFKPGKELRDRVNKSKLFHS